jgi:hypothetical protein
LAFIKASELRGHGSVAVRVFFGQADEGAPFITLKISKSATCGDVVRLVCSRRRFALLASACELHVVGDGQGS